MPTKFTTCVHPDLPGVEVQMAKPQNGWKPKKSPKTARPSQVAKESPVAGEPTTKEKE